MSARALFADDDGHACAGLVCVRPPARSRSPRSSAQKSSDGHQIDKRSTPTQSRGLTQAVKVFAFRSPPHRPGFFMSLTATTSSFKTE